MAEKWTGGCQCGDVRYSIARDSVKTLYCCHCSDCQKQSASAFGMSLITERQGFKLLQGALSVWETRTARDTLKRCHFCPRCGVRIWHDNGDGSALISVKAGTLDDSGVLKPVAHLWTRRAQDWVPLPDSALRFEGEPEAEEEIYKLYRARS